MMKKLLILLFLLICLPVQAGTVEPHTVYTENSQVTYLTLNGNVNNTLAAVNGGLDNNNADTNNGFRFVEVLGSLPTAGTQGRVVYNTATNSLYFDTGVAWSQVVIPDTDPDDYDLLYYEGSAWTTLEAGENGQILTAKGDSTSASWDTLAYGNPVQGDVLYYKASGLSVLPTGTSGQFLKTQGADADPVWSDVSAAGTELLSVTSVTATTNTGDITIEVDKQYLALITVRSDSGDGTDTRPLLRFNSDSGNNYEYARRSLTLANPPVESDEGSAGGSSIALNVIGGETEGGSLFLKIIIDTHSLSRSVSLVSAAVSGEGVSTNNAAYTGFNIYGVYSQNTDPTSFEVTTPVNSDFVVRLYELTQS